MDAIVRKHMIHLHNSILVFYPNEKQKNLELIRRKSILNIDLKTNA